MITIKMACSRKYEIDKKRGWKVFLDVADGQGFEGQGSFVLVSNDDAILNLKPGDSILVGIGFDSQSNSVKVINGN